MNKPELKITVDVSPILDHMEFVRNELYRTFGIIGKDDLLLKGDITKFSKS